MCSQGDGTVFLLYLTMPPQGGFPHHPILQMWGLRLRGVKGLPRKEGCKWWDWNSTLGVSQPKGLGPLSLVLIPEMPTKVFLCFLSCCCHRNRNSPGPWEPVFTPSGHLSTHVRGKGYWNNFLMMWESPQVSVSHHIDSAWFSVHPSNHCLH